VLLSVPLAFFISPININLINFLSSLSIYTLLESKFVGKTLENRRKSSHVIYAVVLSRFNIQESVFLKRFSNSSMEHNLSESSSDTYSDSSRDQSAPGHDEILLLPPIQIYSDRPRDQSVPRDNEPWSLGVRQRVTS
jgi:hypothetical protein